MKGIRLKQGMRGFPSPLWGGARGGGNPTPRCSAIPRTRSLPHKGGGGAVAPTFSQPTIGRALLALAVIAYATLGAGAALAQHAGQRPVQPYADEQMRAVASLSDEDVQGFLDGRGMGLAKAAELNGHPGPMHVLELADELRLTAEQREAVKAAFDRMKSKAKALGEAYVKAERAVDQAFNPAPPTQTRSPPAWRKPTASWARCACRISRPMSRSLRS